MDKNSKNENKLYHHNAYQMVKQVIKNFHYEVFQNNPKIGKGGSSDNPDLNFLLVDKKMLPSITFSIELNLLKAIVTTHLTLYQFT
jgi:hypothetical protein